MPGKPAIECRNVTFSHPDGAPVFKGLTASFPAGGFILLKGPSGAGKSTFLRLLNRMARPSAGEVRLFGTPLADIPPPELRVRVIYLQQTPTLVAASVRENLLLPFSLAANRDRKTPDDERLSRMLSGFLLDTVRLDAPAKELSVGQKQRLCLIRAMLLDPRVLLLDEPTSALDPASREVVENAAESLCLDRGMTVFMVSHAEFTPKRVDPLLARVSGGTLEVG
ncbi:MAG: ATP-binding cassette domain-containing protein [Desulfatibacillaceae bacterium]